MTCTVKQTLPTLSGPSYPILLDSQLAVDSNGSYPDTLSLDFLSPVVSGQLLILIVQSGGAPVLSVPAGFTPLFGDNSTYGIYQKIATGLEGTTFSIHDIDIGGNLIGLKIGGTIGEAIDFALESLATANGPQAITGGNAELLLSILCRQSSNLAGVVPNGWTDVQHSAVSGAHGGPIYTAVAQKNQVLVGMTPPAIWSGTGQSVVTLAVRNSNG